MACLQAARSSSNHAIPLPNSPSCPAFSLAPNPLASQDLPSLLSSHLSSLPLPVDRQRRPLLARHALYVWVAFGRPTLSSSRGNANRLDGDDLSLASRKVLRDGLCTQPRSRSHQLLGDRCTTKRAKGRGGKKGKGGGDEPATSSSPLPSFPVSAASRWHAAPPVRSHRRSLLPSYATSRPKEARCKGRRIRPRGRSLGM
jgi:hypothetical protein